MVSSLSDAGSVVKVKGSEGTIVRKLAKSLANNCYFTKFGYAGAGSKQKCGGYDSG